MLWWGWTKKGVALGIGSRSGFAGAQNDSPCDTYGLAKDQTGSMSGVSGSRPASLSLDKTTSS